MRFCHSLLLAVALSALPACGQWSEPAPVGNDTAWPGLTDVQLASGGDTLWAFYSTRHSFPSPNYVVGHWTLGDSWSGPIELASDTLLHCLAPGVDPQGRVWLSWYNGDYLVDGDTWGIWTRLHDASGWRPERLALRGPEGVMEFPAGQYFAADRRGNWYMGICEENAPLPDLFTSALYSRFQGDTWIWPRAIAIGYGSPIFLDYGLPSLVARPDSGFWAVYERWCDEPPRVIVDHLAADTVLALTAPDSSSSHAATADSSGRLWVLFLNVSGLVSVTIEGGTIVDRSVVSTDRMWSLPRVCTDPFGWVWTCWTRSDTTPVVSYNRGAGWSEPEPVTDMAAVAVDMVSDERGRVYVAFNDMQRRYFTSYRTVRPGMDGGASDERRVTSAATVVRGVINLQSPVSNRQPPSVLLDAAGRKVMELRPGENDVRHLAPGVYFVRKADGEGRMANTKVVVTR
jgi:hypothetical protein